MCRAVQLPRANNVPNIIDWLDVAAERDTDVDLYRLADTHELPGIREEVMNTENVWAYELDPSSLEDEADDSDEEIIEADENALAEKDDNVDEGFGVATFANTSESEARMEQDEDEVETRHKKGDRRENKPSLRLRYIVLAMLLLMLVLTSLADILICLGPWFPSRKPFC